MRNPILRCLLSILVLVFSQVACNLPGAGVEPTLTPLPPTFTPPPTPTPMPSATVTPTPTITPTPLPTFTPTPFPLLAQGEFLPESLQPITFGNAIQVHALAEWKQNTVTSLVWSPDGNRLAVGEAAEIEFYDIHTRQKVDTLVVDDGLVDFDLTPDWRYLASASNSGSEWTGYTGSVSFWRLSDKIRLYIFYLDQRGVSGLSIAPDGNPLVAGVTSPNYIDNNFIFWNTVTYEITRTMRTGGVLDLAFSPDGQAIASTPDRFAIRLWRMKDSQMLYELPTSFTGAVSSLAFSPDGATLATGHYDGVIRTWDVAKGELKQEFVIDGVIESLAFSSDGTLLASGQGYRGFAIHLWDLANGQMVQVLPGHTHAVDHLAFSPDGKLLVSGSYDGTLRLWGVRP